MSEEVEHGARGPDQGKAMSQADVLRQDHGLASDEDARAVRAVLGGDSAAYERLVARHERKAVSVSFRLLGNMQDALDVVQDAFIKAYRSLDMLKDARLFGPWLLRIVSNYSLNFRRGRKRGPTLTLDDVLGAGEEGHGTNDRLADDSTPAVTPGSSELARRIQEAMAKLPDRQRLALVLFSIEGLPQKDVAEVLDCSIEAVKWYVFEARRKLKDLLAEDLDET